MFLLSSPTKQLAENKSNDSTSALNRSISGGFKMLNAEQPFASATRSLYLGGLPEGCTIRDICDVVRGDRGLESVRLLPAKSCAFIDFCTRLGAERFVTRCRRQRLQISGSDCRLGWAKERPLAAAIEKAMEAGATRNVYFSFSSSNEESDSFISKFIAFCQQNFNNSIDPQKYFNNNNSESEEITSLQDPLVAFLFSLFDPFGAVDMIKVVPHRRIAFIHMAVMSDAMRAVAELSIAPEFVGKRLSFGRDRCGERLDSLNSSNTGNSLGNIGHSLGNTGNSLGNTGTSINSTTPASSSTGSLVHRTVFLGSVGADVSIEDICDHIHTGQLQSVRLNPEKRCAFVTFLKAESAEIFLARAMQFGLHIRSSQVKPAFAKERTSSESVSLPAAIQAALRKGVTRNLFLGNVDFNVLSDSSLRLEVGRFGPLDRIQVLKDRGMAFIHFANLLDAGRAFDGLKSDHNFRNCRVGFGRDRCEAPANTAAIQQSAAAAAAYWTHQYYPPPLLYDPASACYYYPTSAYPPEESTENKD